MTFEINNNTQTQNTTSSKTVKSEPKKKPNAGLFDKYFMGKTKEVADSNHDGTISFDELHAYIKNSPDASEEIVLDVAKFLGVEKTSTEGRVFGDAGFINKILQKLNLLKRVDKNQDSNIDYKEITEDSTLDSASRIQLNKIFGIVDGEFNNRQGKLGSCWALTGGTGLAMFAPEMFDHVVKKDNAGNAIVTFYGTEEEPFECKIPRQYIMNRQQARTQQINYSKTYGWEVGKFSSSDPDAIALETAFAAYQKKIENDKKEYETICLKYVQTSTPKPIVKPSTETLTQNITQAQWDEYVNYYHNSDGPNKPVISRDLKYVTPEKIESLKEYIKVSHPIEVKKPTEHETKFNTTKYLNWLKNSEPTTVEKPEIKSFPYTPSVIDGGYSEYAIKLMVGGTYQTFTPENKSEAINALENLNPYGEQNKIASVSFKKKDSDVIPNHAYLITRVTENEVFIIDPHNSNIEKPYSKKRFYENFLNLGVNTLPEKLPD